MNYVTVIIVVVLLFAVVYWYAAGRRYYIGPRIKAQLVQGVEPSDLRAIETDRSSEGSSK